MHEILLDLNLFIRVRNLEQSFINVETTTRYYNVLSQTNINVLSQTNIKVAPLNEMMFWPEKNKNQRR